MSAPTLTLVAESAGWTSATDWPAIVLVDDCRGRTWIASRERNTVWVAADATAAEIATAIEQACSALNRPALQAVTR